MSWDRILSKPGVGFLTRKSWIGSFWSITQLSLVGIRTELGFCLVEYQTPSWLWFRCQLGIRLFRVKHPTPSCQGIRSELGIHLVEYSTPSCLEIQLSWVFVWLTTQIVAGWQFNLGWVFGFLGWILNSRLTGNSNRAGCLFGWIPNSQLAWNSNPAG